MCEIIVAAFSGFSAGLLSFLGAWLAFKRQYLTEDKAINTITALLKSKKWEKRSFNAIKNRLKGFKDDELRKLLVAAGAISFESKENEEELWGLISKNKSEL